MKNKKNYLIKGRILKAKKKSKNINWDEIKVINNIPMSGEQITEEIYKQTGVKITRQGISTAIKISLRKIYINLKREDKTLKPFDIMLKMFEMFYPNSPSTEDADTFFNLFPEDIREEVTNGVW